MTSPSTTDNRDAEPRRSIPTPAELASVLKLPGAQVTATWLPSLVTPRIRNTVKKMLLHGEANGYGAAANITRQVARYTGLTINKHGPHSYTIPALSKELQPRAEALVNAHFAAGLLSGGLDNNSWKRKSTESECTRVLLGIAAGSPTRIDFYYWPLPVSTRDMWDRTFAEIAPITADELLRREQAIALLDSTTPVGLCF